MNIYKLKLSLIDKVVKGYNCLMLTPNNAFKINGFWEMWLLTIWWKSQIII